MNDEAINREVLQRITAIESNQETATITNNAIEKKVDGINLRLDVQNGRLAKVELAQHETDGYKQMLRNFIIWVRDNLMQIVMALAIAYLLFKSGLG